MREWIAAFGILFSPKEWRAAQRRVHVKRVMEIVEQRRCELGIHNDVYLDYPRGHRCPRCGELVPQKDY